MSNRFQKYTNGPWVRGRPEVIANATLIAHAPEMLDALRQWQSAESMRDSVELDNARRSRDTLLKTLEV